MLVFLIYLAGVLDSLLLIALLASLISAVTAIICAYGWLDTYNEESLAILKRFIKTGVITAIVSVLFFTFIPSQKVFYAMVAAYGVTEVMIL
jgi:hypothetical protein